MSTLYKRRFETVQNIEICVIGFEILCSLQESLYRFEHYFVSTEKTNKENDWKARVPRSVQPLQQSKATSEPSSKVSAPDTPSLDTKSPQASPKGPKRLKLIVIIAHDVALQGSLYQWKQW